MEGAHDTKSVVKTCTCGSDSGINANNVGMIVDNILSRVDQNDKTVIKLQIETTKQ